MADEIKLPTIEELETMVDVFRENADKLQYLLATERAKSRELDIENSGWLAVYRRLQSENAALRDEISRLESRIQEHRSGS